MARSILDTIINMNRLHLGEEAVTVYESLEDAGLTAAAINITCYRGRTPHLPTLPGLTIPAYGPKRFFFYNLFESDPTGAPLAVFGRSHGSIDGYAAAVGRWLVTRDGFDFLVYYLPDYDFASHAHGPDEAFEAWPGAMRRSARSSTRPAGPMSSSSATRSCFAPITARRTSTGTFGWRRRSATSTTCSSQRRTGPGMVYRLGGARADARALAERLDGEESAETVLFLEGADAIARRDGEELRFAPTRRVDDAGDEAARVSGRLRASLGRAEQPERRRGDRLGRAGIRVRRPRPAVITRVEEATARCGAATRRCRC